VPARLSPSLAPPVADRQFTRCGPCSMRSAPCCATFCPWRYLPANFPPWPTVFSHFRRLRDPRELDALVTGVAPPSTPADREGLLTQVPKAGDSHSVKTVEESSGICGYDAHKHIKGRKRHILVDTASHPHLYLRDPCRYTRYQRSSLFARRAQILRAASLQRFGQMRPIAGRS